MIAATGRRHVRPLDLVLSVAICIFTLTEVNYPLLSPQSQLAVFAGLALVLCFRGFPLHPRLADSRLARAVDLGLGLLAALCCAYVVIQTEPALERAWLGGVSLGNRAGSETAADVWVGVIGLVLVLEGTRRSIGWALPLLASTFLAYAAFGAGLPDWLFPHRGYGVERIVSQTFLHSQGVFGTALKVMFVYVFLFVLFGAALQASGATGFIIDFARRMLGNSAGGPAKVAVLSSGLMGSLSGSAVANTATTGTFTIPLMRSAGFRAETAAGIEAAASSGGALVPPVMGAGAYMMLEIIDPPVTYLEIVRAALLPAMLYYVSLFMIVHFRSKRIGAGTVDSIDFDASGVSAVAGGPRWAGAVCVAGFATLLVALFLGYTVFRSATVAMFVVVLVAAFDARTRIGARAARDALVKSARDGIPLVTAAACVGVVIGVVTLTGIGTRLPSTILGLAEGNVLGALVLIMVSSIVLGMGLPSAVCYLLMATLIGPVLSQLGIVPLAAHLFIFYFGMMSMVTPPVALAAYAAGSIAGAGIMQTGFAAFRFALVGFTLPYMFVFRPELLMLDGSGQPASIVAIAGSVGLALLGILPLAAAIAGYLFAPLSMIWRVVLFVAALVLLAPVPGWHVAGIALSPVDAIGAALVSTASLVSWRARLR